MEPGTFTKSEILAQPEAWAEAIEKVKEAESLLHSIFTKGYSQVVFTGCGSTYYLSLSAASLFQAMTGIPARGVPASELLFNGKSVLTSGKTLLVAVSRSGSTTETVRAVECFKEQKRGDVIGITNYGDQPLAGLADLPIVIKAGQEESVAQTRSFASMLVAANALTMLAADQPALVESMKALTQVGSKMLSKYAVLAEEIGGDLACDRIYYLGSGPRYGLACEANLKMKEMTLTHSEPFHFLEFRHGPMSMVTNSATIFGMLSESNRAQEEKVLLEMRALGAKTISLAESDSDVVFSSGVPESIRNVLYMPFLQLTSFHRSLAKGLNPDRPSNLTAVVTLNL